MLINLILLIGVFGVARWKKHPYAGAVLLGIIKGGLYFVLPLRTHPLAACIVNGVAGFIVWGGLGAGLVYFLGRLNRYEPEEVHYSTLGTERAVFKWEYLPLAVIVLLMLFGEGVLAVLQ